MGLYSNRGNVDKYTTQTPLLFRFTVPLTQKSILSPNPLEDWHVGAQAKPVSKNAGTFSQIVSCK
jgi:hypothetical protein